jgi:hypothetical protein
MQRQYKNAVVKRLQFAMAELEVISGIPGCDGEPLLMQQLHALTEGVRECITIVNQEAST